MSVCARTCVKPRVPTVLESEPSTSDCLALDAAAGVKVLFSPMLCRWSPPRRSWGGWHWECCSHVLGPPPCLPEDKPSSPNTGPAGAPLNRQDPRPHALTLVQGPAGAARRGLKHTFITSLSWSLEGCHAPGVLDQGVDQGVGRAASLLGLQGIIRSLVSFEPVLLGWWRLCLPSTSAVASQASLQL